MITISNLSASYHSDKELVPAITDISCSIDTGTTCAVIGPSGSGKSTFLRCIAGLQKNGYSGKITVNGEAVDPSEINIGFMPQRFGLLPWKTVKENIELGCRLMNGLVLEPEHSFSFNGTCGPYNGQTGYKVARNISSSGYGTGGGVCQLSTTLYNAALEIPIQVTDWAVHSISGVKYIPVAYDACVGRYSDFCFRNTLPYALRLEAETQGGVLTVRIYRQE